MKRKRELEKMKMSQGMWTRTMEIRTSVFATSNDVEKIIPPLQSRLFIVKMQDYTYEQFYENTVRLLTSDRYHVDEEITNVTAEAVWNTSKNIRDCIKIARMAKSVEDVNWLLFFISRSRFYYHIFSYSFRNGVPHLSLRD